MLKPAVQRIHLDKPLFDQIRSGGLAGVAVVTTHHDGFVFVQAAKYLGGILVIYPLSVGDMTAGIALAVPDIQHAGLELDQFIDG